MRENFEDMTKNTAGSDRKQLVVHTPVERREFRYDPIVKAYFTQAVTGKADSLRETLKSSITKGKFRGSELKNEICFSQCGDRVYLYSQNTEKLSHIEAMHRWQRATGYPYPLATATPPAPVVPSVHNSGMVGQKRRREGAAYAGYMPIMPRLADPCAAATLFPHFAVNFNNCPFTNNFKDTKKYLGAGPVKRPRSTEPEALAGQQQQHQGTSYNPSPYTGNPRLPSRIGMPGSALSPNPYSQASFVQREEARQTDNMTTQVTPLVTSISPSQPAPSFTQRMQDERMGIQFLCNPKRPSHEK